MIKIICQGKLKEEYYKNAENEYKKRINRFCPITIDLTKSYTTHLNEFTVCLDEHGKEITSIEFADFLKRNMFNHKTVCFLIGNWSGLTELDLKQADMIISLSQLNLPYQLCRIVLLEQIYRALTIIRGMSYHK